MFRTCLAGILAMCLAGAAAAQPAQDPPATTAPAATSYGGPPTAHWQPVHPKSAPLDYRSLQQAARQNNRRGAQGATATAGGKGAGRMGGRRHRGG